MLNFRGITAVLIFLLWIIHCLLVESRPIQKPDLVKWLYHRHWPKYNLSPQHHYHFPAFHDAVLRSNDPAVHTHGNSMAYSGFSLSPYRSTSSSTNNKHFTNLNGYNNQEGQSGLTFLPTSKSSPLLYDDRQIYICPK